VVTLSKNQVDEDKKELQELNEELLKEAIAEKNIFRIMVKYWGIETLVIVGLNLLALFLTWALAAANLITIPHLNIDPSKVEKIASDIFTASITVNGLFIGFVPLISFFFIGEVKESQNEIEQSLKEKREKSSDDETKKLIGKASDLYYVIFFNLRSGILKYLQAYVGVSILSEFFLIYFYISTGFSGISSLFMFIDINLLLIIIAGLMPLIAVALHRPTFQLVRYLVVEKEIIGFEAKD